MDGGPDRPWYRRTSRLVVVGVAAAAVVGAAVFAVAWSGRGAREVSPDEALERFRESGGGDAGPDDDAAAVVLPPAGVYTAAADGTERLSLLDTVQQWGPTMPASITHDADGCFTWRIDYSSNHWQDQRLCPSGDGDLLETGGTTFQRFDFVAFAAEDTTVFTCDPPGELVRAAAAPGDSWEQSCTGRSREQGTEVTSAGTNTFVGIEDIEIDGVTVPARHVRVDRTLTGDQAGTDETHQWFAVADGMLLRATHDVEVRSPSPVGDVTYTETGRFELTSLEPAR